VPVKGYARKIIGVALHFTGVVEEVVAEVKSI
jgi:hypothetical protein